MTSNPQWDAWIQQGLGAIREKKLERVLRPLIPTSSPVEAYVHEAEFDAWLAGQPSPNICTSLDQLQQQQQQQLLQIQQQLPYQEQQQLVDIPGFRRLVLFSLNDYMGLSAHPDVRAATAAAAQQVGSGPRSSALVGGFTNAHRQLELTLAQLKGTQDALLFPTGFAANTAVVSVLASSSTSSSSSSSSSDSTPGPQQTQQQQADVYILSDELNHASIIDGARLACRGPGVVLLVYRHNDMQHLEQLLQRLPEGARKLVVTDSLFSMDGDYADLKGLVELRSRYGFLLVVDEAHATLVAGAHGGGAAEAAGVVEHIDVHTGTLSKAVGALGGFVACSSSLRALLLNRGRSVVFSTALPVPVVVAAQAAIEVAAREPWRQQHLHHLMSLVRTRLGVPVVSPIIPLVVGSEAAALGLSRALLQAGFHVPAIRPPTVPAGTCRLRMSLSAAHTTAQVTALCDMLLNALAVEGVRLQSLPFLEYQQQQHLGQQEQQHWEEERQQQQQQQAVYLSSDRDMLGLVFRQAVEAVAALQAKL